MVRTKMAAACGRNGDIHSRLENMRRFTWPRKHVPQACGDVIFHTPLPVDGFLEGEGLAKVTDDVELALLIGSTSEIFWFGHFTIGMFTDLAQR